MDIQPLRHAKLSDDARRAFAELEVHLTQGRDGGAWCRWVARSIDAGKFFVGDAIAIATVEALAGLVDEAASALSEISAGVPNPAVSLTLRVGAVPGDASQQLLQGRRLDLLRRGVMVALLHPEAQFGALSPGPKGTPYATSDAFLTFRWAMPQDALFVDVNPTLAAALEEFLRSGPLRTDR